jgi:hypothetical protein
MTRPLIPIVGLLLATAAIWASESSGEVAGRTVQLTGVLSAKGKLSVFLVPGSGKYFSPMMLSEGSERDGIRLKKAGFAPPEADLIVEGKSLKLKIPGPGANREGAAPEKNGELALVAAEMPLNQFLDLYSILSQRTVIREESVDNFTFTARATGNLERLVGALEAAVREKELVLTNYSEKFALLAPSKGAISKLRHIEPHRRGVAQEQVISAGAIAIQGMPFDQFLKVFEMYSGMKVIHDPKVPGMNVTFKQATDLTRAEVVEGFELLLHLNHFQVDETNETLRISRESRF